MGRLTLKLLAQRIDALEQAVGIKPPSPDNNNWLRVVGMFGDSEFMRKMDEEGRRIREAEREQARRELAEE